MANECIEAIGEAIEATQKSDYRVFSPLSGPLNLDSLRKEGTEGDLVQLVTQLTSEVRAQGRQLDRLLRASRSVSIIPDVTSPFRPALSLTTAFNIKDTLAPSIPCRECGHMTHFADINCEGCGLDLTSRTE